MARRAAGRGLAAVNAARVHVRGRVQGVGYRPFVARLAMAHGLRGWVANDGDGVEMQVAGPDVAGFVAALRRDGPPMARVESVEVGEITGVDAGGFTIRPSLAGPRVTAILGADTSPCDTCLTELFDPRDRRYLYPFLACVDCGPRYTITRRLPYDRAGTAMVGFPMCPACAREAHDPTDRRFHAQALACPACGPRLSRPLADAVATIRAGGIVALKGMGGFHLLCDARDARAVARLRARKGRGNKPFAGMVANLASARRIADLDPEEAALLEDPRRPVVICPAHPSAALASGVAPGLTSLGLMLPATAAHWVLLHALLGELEGRWWEEPTDLVLVATSANRAGEPLIIDDDDPALRTLADLTVGHDRAIVARCDDTVARVIDGAPLLVRRARGWCQEPVPVPVDVEGILAFGAERRATVALGVGRAAHVSPHLGDVEDAATLAGLHEAVTHLTRLTGVSPTRVAHDLHPDFLPTRVAEATGLPARGVAHHHAHAAAVLAEHGRTGPAFAVVLDGFGLGPDGGAWGGELLHVHGATCERLAHLPELPLPGGDRAVTEPWRVAVGVLVALGETDRALARWGDRAARLLPLLPRAPRTSSAGRWFDVAAAILGVCDQATWDGEPAARLEALVDTPVALPGFGLDLYALIRAILALSPAEGAAVFHGTLAAGIAEWAAAAAGHTGEVVLTGGCFVNRPFTEAVLRGLRARGVTPLLPRQLPPGDGAIALGQLGVAAISESAAR